jgi:uncharacterized protein (TIGR00162 family)
MPTKVFVLKKIRPESATVLVGLPGIGLVGKIAVDYLLKQFKPAKIAEVYSDSFPPSVQTKNSKVMLIKNEIFHMKKGKRDFILFSGPVQPSLDFKAGSAHEHYEFAESMVNFFRSIGATEMVTLAGVNVGQARLNRKPNAIVAGTDDRTIAEWVKAGAKKDKKEGLIAGAAGLLVGLAKLRRMDGACIMGETNSQLVYGDHGSAKRVIEVLAKKYNFKINMKKIDKETKEIEKQFNELNKQLEAIEDDTPKDGLNYVR